ncbi:hypothetical protein FIBSPDRAFT_930735 [Athelia psychrophila]|uniref:ATP-dependent RNA helicase n=1 Tax=Athelia psychrophila TaxID=1759441 RepID=A0A166LIE8_9AGAM|nr:hypothetical protein FIBSPDRAFT_930735 [Fibularhizoctonia sp. CBS 109695]
MAPYGQKPAMASGSGKTLAYGLPILRPIIARPNRSKKTKRRLKTLALALGWQGRCVCAPPRATKGNANNDPGCLWDIIEDDDELAKQIRGLKFLVVDEANRMVEAGHFEEFEHILRLTFCDARRVVVLFASGRDADIRLLHTLRKDLQRNVKKRSSPRIRGKKDKGLTTLLLRLDFRDPEPTVIEEKDVYLYYFLPRYPGRSLVFLYTIDGIRHCIQARAAAAPQESRQANALGFKGTPNSALLAADIPAVDHIIHYQIPCSADAYVHRNGRTARAMRKGFSMLMREPDEW